MKGKTRRGREEGRQGGREGEEGRRGMREGRNLPFGLVEGGAEVMEVLHRSPVVGCLTVFRP